MAKYREMFSLQLRDIEIIENALRSELSRYANHALADESKMGGDSAATEINQLLAKIYHQKVFYSQVQKKSFPGG